MDPDAAGKAALGITFNSGEIAEIPQTATKAEYIIAINKLIAAHNKNLSLTVYPDSSGTRRFMIGYQKDGWGVGKDFGIKLSDVGYDVFTAPDVNLLFKLAY